MAISTPRSVESSTYAIPLLDASNLPSADDWALLEAMQINADIAGVLDTDLDRFGRVTLTAAFDE